MAILPTSTQFLLHMLRTCALTALALFALTSVTGSVLNDDVARAVVLTPSFYAPVTAWASNNAGLSTLCGGVRHVASYSLKKRLHVSAVSH